MQSKEQSQVSDPNDLTTATLETLHDFSSSTKQYGLCRVPECLGLVFSNCSLLRLSGCGCVLHHTSLNFSKMTESVLPHGDRIQIINVFSYGFWCQNATKLNGLHKLKTLLVALSLGVAMWLGYALSGSTFLSKKQTLMTTSDLQLCQDLCDIWSGEPSCPEIKFCFAQCSYFACGETPLSGSQ